MGVQWVITKTKPRGMFISDPWRLCPVVYWWGVFLL